MVKTGLASYPLPLPPKGMESAVTGPGIAAPLRVATALGAPPIGVVPPKATGGGVPAGYEPPAGTFDRVDLSSIGRRNRSPLYRAKRR